MRMIPFMMEECFRLSKSAKPTARSENEQRTCNVVGFAAARLCGLRARMSSRRDELLGPLSARPFTDPGQRGGAPSFDSFWASVVSILVLFEYHIINLFNNLWIRISCLLE
jgi:hypothetical protein